MQTPFTPEFYRLFDLKPPIEIDDSREDEYTEFKHLTENGEPPKPDIIDDSESDNTEDIEDIEDDEDIDEDDEFEDDEDIEDDEESEDDSEDDSDVEN